MANFDLGFMLSEFLDEDAHVCWNTQESVVEVREGLSTIHQLSDVHEDRDQQHVIDDERNINTQHVSNIASAANAELTGDSVVEVTKGLSTVHGVADTEQEADALDVETTTPVDVADPVHRKSQSNMDNGSSIPDAASSVDAVAGDVDMYASDAESTTSHTIINHESDSILANTSAYVTEDLEPHSHQGSSFAATGGTAHKEGMMTDAAKESQLQTSKKNLKAFIHQKKNANTIKKTEQAHRKLQGWLAAKGEHRDIENIPAGELDIYVGEFILQLRKEDGSEYEPDSLTSFHRGIDRYLKEKEYGESLVQSECFQMSRDALASKRKDLKQKGKGNKPKRAEALTGDDEETLWKAGILGTHNPQALLNSVWFFNTKLFGFRGSDENRKLKWGDIALKEENSVQYLEFNERTTKTRTGNTGTRPFAPKQFSNKENPERCPVRIYQEYAARRPEMTKTEDYAFYLAINHKRATHSSWYKCQPVGVNTLQTMMRTMAQEAGIAGRITNHSVRKTMCTQLLHAGVSPLTVAQLSGHKNVASLNNYAIASKDQQKDMCNILSNSTNTMALTPMERSHASDDADNQSHSFSTPSAEGASQSSLSGPSGVYGLFSGANISGGSFTLNINMMQMSGCDKVGGKKAKLTEQ